MSPLGERRYVVDIDTSAATVTLGSRAELLRDRVHVRDLTFVDGEPDDSMLHAQVRAHGEPIRRVPRRERRPLRANRSRASLPVRWSRSYDGDTFVGGGIAA